MQSFLHGVAEYLTPVLTSSQFQEKGVLTPEEFVLAGDQLTFKCPTWQWSSGDPASAKSFLPPDKQVLVTRNVPCLRRVRDLEFQYKGETEVSVGDGEGDEDGWLATHMGVDTGGKSAEADDDDDDDTVIGSTDAPSGATDVVVGGVRIVENHVDTASSADAGPGADAGVDASSGAGVGGAGGAGAGAGAGAGPSNPVAASAGGGDEAGAGGSDSDDDYVDMATFEEDNLMEDTAAAVPAAPAAAPFLRATEPEDNILRTRTYDITISYDKYYQTPRVFLFGYDEHHTPLTSDQVFEDVMQDYANRTVTFETNPHQPAAGLHAAIHPCRHAETMKRIIDHVADGGQQVRVDQYLFVFLKFIQSVVPTINYDYTMSVAAK